jgi:uncharacterized protein YndB with AHSA1/START domain
MEFTSRFLVARRPPEVFAYLSAFERIPEWNADVRTCELLDPGEIRVGSRFSQRRRRLGSEQDQTFAVTAFVHDRTISVESTTPGSEPGFDWRLEDRGPQTLATLRLQIALPGPRLSRPLVARLVRRRVAANMRRLTAQIETAR